jgi:hypothetical protein
MFGFICDMQLFIGLRCACCKLVPTSILICTHMLMHPYFTTRVHHRSSCTTAQLS